MKITNTQKGPRGINTASGPVLIEAGQSITADVYERERQHIETTQWFEFEGSFTADPSRPNAPVVASAQAAANTELEDLKRQLAERDAELAKLKAGGADEREDLKKQAKELGVDHAPNISNAKLKELIDAKLAS